MHDIWNPWHGCRKYSEGCDHCYMFFLDRLRNMDPTRIAKTRSGFDYPLQKRRDGSFKIRSGELIRVCMTSDFFLPEADPWREDAWDMIRQRPDVKFWLLTKRAYRIRECLPYDWGDGWDNVMLNVTAENQRAADERLPILLSLPARHKGVMCAPLLGPIQLAPYLQDGQIRQVLCGGENYDGARPCDFDWVRALRRECEEAGVGFFFTETGTVFLKDGKRYRIPRDKQGEMALKSGMNFPGEPIRWRLTDNFGQELPLSQLHVPRFRERCGRCGNRPVCNGCSDCGRCDRARGRSDRTP